MRRNDGSGIGMEVEGERIFRITRLAAVGVLGFVADGERVGNGVSFLVQLELSGVVLLPDEIRRLALARSRIR